MITILKASKSGKFWKLSTSEGMEYKLDPEIYYQYNLREGDQVDLVKFDLMLNENDLVLCRSGILNLLGYRMHSEHELKSKLKSKGFSREIIKKALEEVKRLNLLDDELFAKNYTEELLAKGQGKYKIIAALKKRGIPSEFVDKMLTELEDSGATEQRIEELLNKKMRTLQNKNLEPLKIKERLIRHLVSKGFPAGIVFQKVDEYLE